MDLRDLRDNARNHCDRVWQQEEREEWAISVNCVPDSSVEEVAARAKRLNRQMCVSTVEEIRAVGYEVRSDWREDGHSNIVFDGEPTEYDLLRVKSVFRGPFANPGRPI